ncbi:hypothetical protein BU24DRAFT_205994 [Aaosphaeria arxii CBS 175.79]|uniref:F-box domain-containing protein n=1 Tax=Aaosphaeria arxii CBS 175.79 TaxID=1450172 RepID=A0A6A5XTG5_9PLEO|nr:uncharacterized protein BU24DRAFT_205994 [Aaosphaeria arxii CBS 175.79]KAF2016588.1 hypothetical protein BU24DRAFT_205994 [Aaosphaeria arxii CBS 175.79]
MSAAGAAHPPPSPPPPPPRGFHSLPAELLLLITQYIRTEDYLSFALAIYPTLERHGLVPPLTVGIYHRIIGAWQNRAAPVENTRPDPPGPGILPIELVELILRSLEPADVIAVIFAHRRLIARYLPATSLSPATRERLWSFIGPG